MKPKSGITHVEITPFFVASGLLLVAHPTSSMEFPGEILFWILFTIV
jgi:hypothetical protein